jgi:hypothetical protein
VWPRPGVVSWYVRPVVSERDQIDTARDTVAPWTLRTKAIDVPSGAIAGSRLSTLWLVNVSCTSPLPEALTQGKTKVRVRFVPRERSTAGPVFGVQLFAAKPASTA